MFVYYFQFVPLCTMQMHTIGILCTHSVFSPVHGHGYTCTNLFSMHSGCFGKALPLLHLTTQCICFSIASWGRSQGSCWAGKWKAAVFTQLNGCSSRPWRDLQVSGAAQKVDFSALGKHRYSLKEIHNKRPMMARRSTDLIPFSSVEILLDGCSIWCYALLILATCSSSRIAGRQPHRHDMGSTWWGGHKALNRPCQLSS